MHRNSVAGLNCPGSRRLKVHRLPPGENRADIYLIWRKGADSPKVRALRDILTRQRARRRDPAQA
jgi:DNA-binding transcriptional LysR family regulator